MPALFIQVVVSWVILLTLGQWLILSGVDMFRARHEWMNEATARAFAGALAVFVVVCSMVATWNYFGSGPCGPLQGLSHGE